MLSVNIGDYGSWLVDALTKCLYAWINLVCPLPERYRMPTLLGCPRPSSKWQLGRTPWYQRTDILYVIRSQNTTLMSGWVNYVCICTVRVQFIKFNIASGHATSGHGHAICFWTARYCKKTTLKINHVCSIYNGNGPLKIYLQTEIYNMGSWVPPQGTHYKSSR